MCISRTFKRTSHFDYGYIDDRNKTNSDHIYILLITSERVLWRRGCDQRDSYESVRYIYINVCKSYYFQQECVALRQRALKDDHISMFSVPLNLGQTLSLYIILKVLYFKLNGRTENAKTSKCNIHMLS